MPISPSLVISKSSGLCPGSGLQTTGLRLFILLLGQVTLLALAGCATAPYSGPLYAFHQDASISQLQLAVVSSNQCAQPSGQAPQLVTLELPSSEPPAASLFNSTVTFAPTLALDEATQTGSGQAMEDSGIDPNPFTKNYLKLVWWDVKETFTAPVHWQTRDWLIFGGVVAGVGTVMVFDKDIMEAVQRNRTQTLDDVCSAIEPFGAEYVPGVLGAFYVGGLIFKDDRAKEVALDGASASLIASGLILYPLKYTVGRSRPNAHKGAYDFQPFSGADSFPSGHATEAFAIATVIAEHYDSIWIKVGSYGLASMVGYARMERNYHWASDVLAGAAIGTFVGHVVVHFNRNHWRVRLEPVLGPKMQGGELSFAW